MSDELVTNYGHTTNWNGNLDDIVLGVPRPGEIAPYKKDEALSTGADPRAVAISAMGIPVYVAIWTHRHGAEYQVFTSLEAADHWAEEIVADNFALEWQRKMTPETPMPSIDNIVEASGIYWGELVDGEEGFEVIRTELKG